MIIDFVLGAIVPFILLVIAFFFIKKYRNENVVKWVTIAVKAAEQLFDHGDNDAKFEYVADFITEKFNLSSEEIINLIESAVYELKE